MELSDGKIGDIATITFDDIQDIDYIAPIEYEDISDSEDSSTSTVIYWQPDDLTPGQSAMYLVLDPRYPPEIVTLDNWE